MLGLEYILIELLTHFELITTNPKPGDVQEKLVVDIFTN
jgi:hypothetical protein